MISELISEEVQRYINEHLFDDTAELLLKEKSLDQALLKHIIEQIKSKRKAKNKLPSWFKTDGLIYPKLISMEQCSSEETARYKALLVAGNQMVDLTGGFGVDTYFLSKSFQHTEYVEKDQLLSEQAAHNFNLLNAGIHVNHSAAESFLELMDNVDLVYVDPARRDLNSQKVFQLEECTPNVIKLLPEMLNKSDRILIKLAPLLDIKSALKDLSHVVQVVVIAVKNEVKELLFDIEKDFRGEAVIRCINLKQKEEQEFSFFYSDEEGLHTESNQLGRYLYEPNASILKSGAFKSIGSRFKLQKLDPNTHLYTSNHLVADFPGRCFEAIKDLTLNKRIKKDLPNMKANISVRNYPVGVDQIRKKTNIKEGGDDYIFAFTDKSGKRVVLCQKKY